MIAIIELLWFSVALAAKKATSEPDVVTPFLTEADLNKALMKFLYWGAGIAAPILLVEILRLIQERKNNVQDIRNDIHEIKLMLAGHPNKMREIAREEIQYVRKLEERRT